MNLSQKLLLMSRVNVADGLPDGSEKPGEARWAGLKELWAGCAGLEAYSRNNRRLCLL